MALETQICLTKEIIIAWLVTRHKKLCNTTDLTSNVAWNKLAFVDKTHPSWSIAITLKCLARKSKFLKKKPWEAPYPCTITSVGESSLLSKVTVLMNLGSLLVERNHLTLDPGGPDPMLTFSWVCGVLIFSETDIRIQNFYFKNKGVRQSAFHHNSMTPELYATLATFPIIRMQVK